MPTAQYQKDETFAVQFAWKLPNEDYLRAVFQAQVLAHVDAADKYVIRLTELLAGRQENKDGKLHDVTDFSKEYWALAGKLIGRKITVAYEADDGRAIHMRLATLTGEHNYFYRFPD